MPKKLSLSQHLSTQELLNRYRNSGNVIEKSHYQVIWLLSTGKTPKQVAEMTSYSQTWVYQLINRYNHQGEKGLGDLRAFNQGKEPLLGDVQQAQLHQVLTTVWSEDEHRLGLQPVLRRVWTPIGEQPIATVKTQYQWLWLYGFATRS
jgi:Winged helix-turn helix